MRKVLAMVFLASSVFSLPLFFLNHVLNTERFVLGILTIPLVILGGELGHKVSDKVPKGFFRVLTILLVLVASLQVIWGVLRGK